MKIFIITTVLALLASSNFESVAANKIRGTTDVRHLQDEGDDEGDGVTTINPRRPSFPAFIPDGDDIAADSLLDCGLAKCPRGYICSTDATGNAPDGAPGTAFGNPMCEPCGQVDEPCCDDETHGGCNYAGLYCDLSQDPTAYGGTTTLTGAGKCTKLFDTCGGDGQNCCPGFECFFDTTNSFDTVCDPTITTCGKCGHAVDALCCLNDDQEFYCAGGLVCDSLSTTWPYVCKLAAFG